jgi:hypothetical protein
MTKKPQASSSVSGTMKKLLADESHRIELDDFVTDHIQQAMISLSLENFPPSIPVTDGALAQRLKKYEDCHLAGGESA